MTCFAKIKIKKKSSTGLTMGYQEVPCKRCHGCRMQKSKEWAIRCIHEAKLYGDKNAFITLTYNNDHLPKDNSLNHEHFQKFIRSLRKRTKQTIRYYMCGEYGRATKKNNNVARPHFHAIIFGYDFPDKTLWTRPNMRPNNPIYRSKILESSWADSKQQSRGFSELGSVTFKSAAYVARYILKKQEKQHYAIVDQVTGEITGYRQKEYTHMSLKPGIGDRYFHENMIDLYEYVMIRPGEKLPVPQFYKDKLKIAQPELSERLRLLAVKAAKLDRSNSTPERLKVRSYLQDRQIQKLKRDLI